MIEAVGFKKHVFAGKAQNFEAVAQYQFDFGLRPSLGYVLSKGKDIEGVGSEDLVNYIDVGLTYYFNKNMNAFVDYKINQLLFGGFKIGRASCRTGRSRTGT